MTQGINNGEVTQEEVITAPIVEIFRSLQGEGLNSGHVAVFVRFAGCNLSCPWCDTRNSWDKNVGEQTVDEVVEQIVALGVGFVVFTGGEPTLYNDFMTQVIMATTSRYGEQFVFAIETNGTQELPDLIGWVSVSPKPGIDVLDSVLARANEVKIVITKHENIDSFVEELIPKIDPEIVPIFLQPDGFDMQNQAKRIFDYMTVPCKHPNVFLGAQLHKIYDFR